jgi:hypothetical protein
MTSVRKGYSFCSVNSETSKLADVTCQFGQSDRSLGA